MYSLTRGRLLLELSIAIRGCILPAHNLPKRSDPWVDDQTVVVQGYGHMGRYAAEIVHDGRQLIAASNRRGGVYNPYGLDQRAFANQKE